LRRDQPYLAYGKVDFSVPVQTAGDVLARVVVRALEIVESCKIIDQVLNRMPQGPIHAGEIYSVPAGNAVVRIEAPRGERYSPSGQGAHTELCQHTVSGRHGHE
jgi:NADH-quinone oxidoreductase subunit D